MKFIKKMRNREFIEMTLKALSALLASFLAIILMEGMIYAIELNAIYNHSTVAIFYSDKTTAYCIEQETDQYFFNAKNVIFNAPNAFIFSITPIHYVVMVVFVSVVAGFFVYRFIALKKDYDKIIKEFNETGTIEITNL